MADFDKLKTKQKKILTSYLWAENRNKTSDYVALTPEIHLF